jgi:hypothetical protein
MRRRSFLTAVSLGTLGAALAGCDSNGEEAGEATGEFDREILQLKVLRSRTVTRSGDDFARGPEWGYATGIIYAVSEDASTGLLITSMEAVNPRAETGDIVRLNRSGGRENYFGNVRLENELSQLAVVPYSVTSGVERQQPVHWRPGDLPAEGDEGYILAFRDGEPAVLELASGQFGPDLAQRIAEVTGNENRAGLSYVSFNPESSLGNYQGGLIIDSEGRAVSLAAGEVSHDNMTYLYGVAPETIHRFANGNSPQPELDLTRI